MQYSSSSVAFASNSNLYTWIGIAHMNYSNLSNQCPNIGILLKSKLTDFIMMVDDVLVKNARS